jgi:hypothetical protein
MARDYGGLRPRPGPERCQRLGLVQAEAVTLSRVAALREGEGTFNRAESSGTLHQRASALLTLAVTCVLVAAVVGVVVYVTRIVKPKRVKFTAGVWKLVNVSFEAEAGSEPKVSPMPDKLISHGR